MLWADIVYVALLLLSIAIGPFYRKIEDVHTKQWISTIIGVTIVTIASGIHVIHPLLTTLVNAIIITKLSPKKCHLISFFFSFFYLLIVFRLGHWVGLPVSPTHTNLIVMVLTLKLPGLAFEINSASTAPPDDAEGVNSQAMQNLGMLNVFHYAFSYMGVLTGPYYRYRTYWDSLHRPFSKYADPWPITFYKLKQITAFVVLFLIMSRLFPSQYLLTDEFTQRPFLYKYLYMFPEFGTFRLRMYIGTILSECGCQMAGLGAYPIKTNPLPGRGPKEYKMIEAMSSTPEKLKDEEQDFETVHNMNVGEVESCVLIRTAMKAWNTCIQYWMAVCIYKRFPHKGLRTFATLSLSALWHGYAPGYYFCICQIPLFLSLEDICVKYYKNSEENSAARKAWGLFLWHLKSTCMAYLAVPFQLLRWEEIFYYYRSIYFGGHILAIVLHVLVRIFKPYLATKHVDDKQKIK